MIKRLVLFIVIIVITIFASACGYIEITCRITENNYAYMGIKIDVSTDDLDENDSLLVNDTLDSLSEYWQEKGFTTEIIKYKDNIVLAAYLKERTENRQDAYEKLISFMTSEVSPFSDVESGYASSFFSDKQYISAKLDFSSIIDMEFIDTLPQTQHTRIVEALNNISGKVIFDFPGYIIDYDGKTENDSISKELTLFEPLEIMLKTSRNNTSNINEYKAIKHQTDVQQRNITTFIIIISITGFLIIMLTVLLVLSLRKDNINQNESSRDK